MTKITIIILIVTLSACLTVSLSQFTVTVPSSEPYMLVANQYGVLQISMEGSNTYRQLISEIGIAAIDYHYRRDQLFWVNNIVPTLKFTTLTNTTAIKEVYVSGMSAPSGVAVDWINDKVYWIEREKRIIRVYDLKTEAISAVINLQPPSFSMKLKILPHIGLLFWGDRNKQGIQRLSVDKVGSETEILSGILCPYSLALNIRTGYLYTIDGCTGAMKTSRMDGSNEETISRKISVGLVYGASLYSDKVFWTEQTTMANVQYAVLENALSQKYFTMDHDIFNDVAIVHPSNQPSEAQIVQYSVCKLACLNGNCTWDGQCICEVGWTGSNCTTDINECESNHGGCNSSQPTTASIATTVPPTTAPPTTKVPRTNSRSPMTTSAATTAVLPTLTVPLNKIGPPSIKASPTTTALPTTIGDLINKSSSAEAEITLNEGVLNRENKQSYQETVIIAIVASATGFIVLFVLVLYAVLIYLKCQHHRRGSYDVYKRYRMTQNRRVSLTRQSDYEQGSIHTTFTDVPHRIENSHSPEQSIEGSVGQ